MKANPFPGNFIALEGIDGTGKTTQAKMLKDFLEKHFRLEVIPTKEPTQGRYGREAREILKNKGYRPAGSKITDEQIQELFIKDRAEHRKQEEVLLREGKVVISDRDFLSTLAYGKGAGLDVDLFLKKHKEILGEAFFIPNLNILIDMEPLHALERLKKKKSIPDYFERADKLARNRRAYLELARELPPRYPSIKIVVIDGKPDKYQVFEQIKRAIK